MKSFNTEEARISWPIVFAELDYEIRVGPQDERGFQTYYCRFSGNDLACEALPHLAPSAIQVLVSAVKNLRGV